MRYASEVDAPSSNHMPPKIARSIQKGSSVCELRSIHRPTAKIAPKANTGTETTTSHHLIFGSRILCLEKNNASMLRPASHQKNMPMIGQLRSRHVPMIIPLGVHSICAGLKIAYVMSGKPPGRFIAATAHSLASTTFILSCRSGSDRSNGSNRGVTRFLALVSCEVPYSRNDVRIWPTNIGRKGHRITTHRKS